MALGLLIAGMITALLTVLLAAWVWHRAYNLPGDERFEDIMLGVFGALAILTGVLLVAAGITGMGW